MTRRPAVGRVEPFEWVQGATRRWNECNSRYTPLTTTPGKPWSAAASVAFSAPLCFLSELAWVARVGDPEVLKQLAVTPAHSEFAGTVVPLQPEFVDISIRAIELKIGFGFRMGRPEGKVVGISPKAFAIEQSPRTKGRT